MPLVQRWAVSLPPVLSLLSALVFGILFGIVGILFATPLMVVLMILVRSLYVERLEQQLAFFACTAHSAHIDHRGMRQGSSSVRFGQLTPSACGSLRPE